MKIYISRSSIFTVLTLSAMLAASGPVSVFAGGAPRFVDEGNAAYQSGSLAEAAALYEDAREEDPESPVPLFNLGVVLYEQGNYPAALTAFQSIETAEGKIVPLIHYNQGNALARLGKKEESEHPREAMDYYLKSIAAYKRALSIEPGHIGSAYNIEIVRIWIRDLSEKMEETPGSGTSSKSRSEEKKEQNPGTSRGGQSEQQEDLQPEQDEGGDTSPPESYDTPSTPQDEAYVPRDETAHAILQEEKQRREAESRIRGGFSEDDKPTW
jgi:tetratricopeptide (TPR) repeat protein